MNKPQMLGRRDAARSYIPPSRRWRLAGAALVAIVVVCWLLAAGDVSAENGTATGIAIVPRSGEAQGIHVATQSIDVRFLGDATSCTASTSALVRLSNPQTKTITVTLAVEGDPLAPGDAIDLSASLGKRIVATATITDSAAFSATIGIPASSAVDVRYQVTQTVRVMDGIVDYRIPLALTDLWAGTPESARVAIHFDEPVSFESVLAVSPDAPHRTPSMMEWQWEQQRLLEDIRLVFAMPDWWSGMVEHRAAARAASASAEDYLRFASDLQRLAALPAERQVVSGTIAARYRSAALAELRLALATAPSDDAAHQTHLQLGHLFLERAQAESGALRDYYYQLAANEANMDLQGAANAEALQLLDEIEAARLNAIAGAAGGSASTSPAMALSGIEAADEATRHANEVASRSLQALRAGQPDNARSVLSELDEASSWFGSVATPPSAEQAVLTIRLSPAKRSYELALRGGENSEPAWALLDAAAQSAQSCGATEVARDGDALRFSIPLGATDVPDEMSHAIAAALPDVPEMALLRLLLASPAAGIRYGTEEVAAVASYWESVDTLDAWLEWNGMAERLDLTAGEPAESNGLPPEVMERIQLIRSELLHGFAGQWRALSDSSRVIVELRSADSGPIERQWMLPAGSASILTWQRETTPSLLVLQQEAGAAWGRLLGR